MIISVQVCYDLPTCIPYARVFCARLPGIRVSNVTEFIPSGIFLDFLFRIIRRPIVYNDNLIILECLRQDRIKAFINIFSIVIASNNYAYLRTEFLGILFNELSTAIFLLQASIPDIFVGTDFSTC